jgi:hypothetical protein
MGVLDYPVARGIVRDARARRRGFAVAEMLWDREYLGQIRVNPSNRIQRLPLRSDGSPQRAGSENLSNLSGYIAGAWPEH